MPRAHERGPAGLAAKLSLSAAAVAVALASVEIFVRVAWPHSLVEMDMATFSRSSDRPGQQTELIPGAHNEHFVGGAVRINSQGLRGPELTEREPGGVRLLAVGDSITFGYGVEEGAVFHQQLASRLNEIPGGARYEALNLGLSGAGLPYIYHQIRARCAELDPDLILIGVGLNDIIAYGPDVLDPDPPPRARPRTNPLRRASEILQRRSFLYAKFFLSVKSVLYDAGAMDLNEVLGFTFLPIQEPSPAQDAAWERSLAVLEAAFDQADACGAPAALLIFPLEIQIDEAALETYRSVYGLRVGADATSGAPQRRLMAFAAERGVAAIDLLPAFRRSQDAPLYLRNRTMTIDPVHPSTLGHWIAAESIHDGLARAGLAPAGG